MSPAFTFSLPAWTGTHEILRPGSGDTVGAGEVFEVAWRVTGDPGSDSLSHASIPSDLASGTYRMRISSLADTTVFAFSSPFVVQGGGIP